MKRTTTVCSEVGVEAVVFSEAGDETAVCFGARIKDDRRHDDV
jgi:hypothetical protein